MKITFTPTLKSGRSEYPHNRKGKIAYIFDKYGDDVVRDFIADDVRQQFHYIEDEDVIADIIDTVIAWALPES
jgi:hypothetical protein